MPRYFIDTDDGDRVVRDEVGYVCADAPAARRLALAALPSMATDVIPDGDQRVLSTTVRDEAGLIVYEATLTLSGRWMNIPASSDAEG